MIVLGLGIWALGIPLSLVIRSKPEQYGYLPDGRVSREPAANFEAEGKDVEMGFKEALRKRSFLYLNMVEAIRMMTLFGVVTHVMPYLSSVGIPRHTAGLVAGAIPLFSIMGRFGFGWLGDVFDKRYVLAWTFCFLGLGTLAFCFVHSRWAIFLFLFLFSPGFGGGSILRGAILREYFGRDFFGKMLGILMGSAAVGGIIGPTVAGWVFDTLGSYQVIWLVLCGLIGLATGLTLRIR